MSRVTEMKNRAIRLDRMDHMDKGAAIGKSRVCVYCRNCRKKFLRGYVPNVRVEDLYCSKKCEQDDMKLIAKKIFAERRGNKNGEKT